MDAIPFPVWLIVSVFVWSFLMMIVASIFFFKWISIYFKDAVIFIDKNNRWNIDFVKLSGKDKIESEKGLYHLDNKAGILSRRGKALYIFSKGNSNPLRLGHEKSDWLDAESIKGYIQNELIKKVVTPRDKFIDMLLLFGAIGGILACLSSVIILLIQLGVIKVT